MKQLAANEPQRATELLQQAPQLAAAVFQTLLLMGLVSPEAVSSVVEPGAPPAAQAPNPAFPAPPMPGYPAQQAPTHTPPVAGIPFATPQPQGFAAPPAAAGLNTDDLMRQVMELPDAQINMLGEAERQQILALRAQFAAQRR